MRYGEATERLRAARQVILDKIAEREKQVMNAQLAINGLNMELAGFDAALRALDKPELEQAPVRGQHD